MIDAPTRDYAFVEGAQFIAPVGTVATVSRQALLGHHSLVHRLVGQGVTRVGIYNGWRTATPQYAQGAAVHAGLCGLVRLW
jgi:hypothetical protein